MAKEHIQNEQFFAFGILYCTSAHCGQMESVNDTKRQIISLQSLSRCYLFTVMIDRVLNAIKILHKMA